MKKWKGFLNFIPSVTKIRLLRRRMLGSNTASEAHRIKAATVAVESLQESRFVALEKLRTCVRCLIRKQRERIDPLNHVPGQDPQN